MTRQQRRVLLILQDGIDEGRRMTQQEIAWKLGLESRSGVHRMLKALLDQGYVERGQRRGGAYRVVRRIRPLFEPYYFDSYAKELRRGDA